MGLLLARTIRDAVPVRLRPGASWDPVGQAVVRSNYCRSCRKRIDCTGSERCVRCRLCRRGARLPTQGVGSADLPRRQCLEYAQSVPVRAFRRMLRTSVIACHPLRGRSPAPGGSEVGHSGDAEPCRPFPPARVAGFRRAAGRSARGRHHFSGRNPAPFLVIRRDRRRRRPLRGGTRGVRLHRVHGVGRSRRGVR